MNITRRQFLGGMFGGALVLLFGRFFNFFNRHQEGKTARYWKKSGHLAG